jgi:hypothetical protein
MADNDQLKTPSGAAETSEATTDTTNEGQRSLDIGESGQHAPGGYYNQQDATKTERIDLDEQFSPAKFDPAKDEKMS